MCQDEDENEDEHQSFGSFWDLCMTNEPILQYIIVLRAWFVRHRLYPEQTKAFVFGFVFVFDLAHEQPIKTQRLWTFAAFRARLRQTIPYVGNSSRANQITGPSTRWERSTSRTIKAKPTFAMMTSLITGGE